MKIIFAGTPDFAVPTLQALIRSEHEVVSVYTQPDRPKGRGRKLTKSPTKLLAERYKIPVQQPKTWRDSQAQQQLSEYGAELMVVAAYGLLLPKAVLAIPKQGCINVHASLLPRWRGAAPIQYAILAGDKETGITIMQMESGLDSGPMLGSVATAIQAEDNSQVLHDRLAELGGRLLVDVINRLELIKPEPQEESLVTHAPKILKQDARVDWQEPATVIARKVRAYYGWPVAFCDFNNDTLRLWQVEKGETVGEPGEFRLIDKNWVEVCCGADSLRLLQVQLPGKRVMSGQAFAALVGSSLK